MPEPLPGSGCSRLFGQGLAQAPPPPLAALGTLPIVLIGCALVLVLLGALGAWRRDLLARLLLALPQRLLYRMRVHGREHVPATGPILLVSNRVSLIDAVLIFLAQRRPVHFVVWAPPRASWGLRLLLRGARAIPIDSAAGPRGLVRSLRNASEVLARGGAVCLFTEAGVMGTGLAVPFQRSFEEVLKRSPVPVVPVCLDHAWGSTFSYRGRSFFRQRPGNVSCRVHVGFGRPLPPTTTATEVRQAIQLLSAELAVGRADERLPVHRRFVRQAARHPLRPCMMDTNNRGRVYRYGEVLAGAKILSDLLRPILADEPMVGIWLPPSAGGVFVNVALALLGKVTVNLNYSLSSQTTHSAIRQCAIRRVLTSRLFTGKVPLEVPAGVELVYVEDFRKHVTTWRRLRSFLAAVVLPGFVLERWVLRLGKHGPDDLATVVFSSGSVAEPKGVMLTHRNLAANVESIVQAIDPRPADRLLGILPFFHSFGYTVTMWVPLQVGTSMVYQADPRQAKETGELCRTYGCTILLTTPTFLRFNLKRCDPGDFKTLRILMCGAEKLPPALAQEFREKFGVPVLEGYGCTELSPVAAANVGDWQGGQVRQPGNKPGTIGRPVPGVAVRLADPETLEPLPPRREGVLLVYGANVMKGYLKKPELTGQVVRDGWYVTGDMATIDEEGFITLTGRLARFSKIGGEMVPHQRIEEELQALMASVEGAGCAVTSVPDPRRGERLVVLHTPLNGLNQQHLCDQLGARGLPNLWVPSARDFFEVTELPVLGSGKLDLKRVKEIALTRAADGP